MMSRTPTSPTSIGKRMSMFSTFFSGPKEACSKLAAAPGLSPGEADCLHDDKLESATLTSIWRSPSSKVFLLSPYSFGLMLARWKRESTPGGITYRLRLTNRSLTNVPINPADFNGTTCRFKNVQFSTESAT